MKAAMEEKTKSAIARALARQKALAASMLDALEKAADEQEDGVVDFDLFMRSHALLTQWYQEGIEDATVVYNSLSDPPRVECHWNVYDCAITVYIEPLESEYPTLRMVATNQVDWEIWYQGGNVESRLYQVFERARKLTS